MIGGRSRHCERFFVGATVALTLVLVWSSSVVANPVYRVVRRGDCLSEIADQYDISVEQLRQWNELDGDEIQIGQRLIVSQSAAAGRRASRRPGTYAVRDGDTLSGIAMRFGLEQSDLERLNPELDPNHIEVGQRLRLRGSATKSAPRRRVRFAMHTVKRGETLSDIANRYGVKLGELLAWNRGVRPQSLRINSKLRVERRRQPSSRSIGLPWNGRLVHARRLGHNRGYVIRDRDRVWGTEETIAAIERAFSRVVARHPRAPRARVHDISLPNGGRMQGHRSHRSGRDVDITYYQRRCSRRTGCPLRNMRQRDMLVAPQWTLLHAWLQRGEAQLIFIDYGLQPALYRQARRAGATPRQLSNWFQYPRGRDVPVGVIRHAANHRNHIHVRFRCPRGDSECH